MADNDDYDFVPDVPSDITVSSQPTSVFSDAAGIILSGLAIIAIVVLYLIALFLNFHLIIWVSFLLDTNKEESDDQVLAGILTAVNGVICAFIIFFAGLLGIDDRGFVGAFWHALVVGLLVLAFMLVIELGLIGLSHCANMKWSTKKSAEKLASGDVEMEGLTSAKVQNDETGDSKV